MGYGFYVLGDGRPAGYGVVATCDRRGCGAEIDRGLAYLCGDTPHGAWDAEAGCGLYFCDRHLGGVGPRGGCRHRQARGWGRVLSCMVVRVAWTEGREFDPDRTYCLFRRGHDGPHAWDVS